MRDEGERGGREGREGRGWGEEEVGVEEWMDCKILLLVACKEQCKE